MNNEKPKTNNIKLLLTQNHTLFTLTNINKEDKLSHTIASLYFLKNDVEINTINLTKCLNILKIDMLNIIYISNTNDDKDSYDCSENDTIHLRVYQMNLEDLINFIASDSFTINNQNNLYILRDIEWSTFVKLLISKPTRTTVSGGSAGKRHIISKLDTRLVIYLLAIFNLNYPLLNAYNNFDSVEKNYYLPYFDFSNKNQLRKTYSGGNIHIINIPDETLTNDKE